MRDKPRPCPYCRYDLRGQTEPRCPECGRTFSIDAWQAGVLRAHVPSCVDRCDPWQPHQVLLYSLAALLHGVYSLRWVLRRLDLNGPRRAAWIMLVAGTWWAYALTVAIYGVAVYARDTGSPAVCLRYAALIAGPRVLLFALPLAAVTAFTLSLPQWIQAHAVSRAQRLRMCGFLTPILTAHLAWAGGILFVLIALFTGDSEGMAIGLVAVLGLRLLHIGPSAWPRVTWSVAAAWIVFAIVWTWAAHSLLPVEPDVPLWLCY